MSQPPPPKPPEETASKSAGKGPGAQLVAARKSRGLSQEEVGDSLNLAPQTVEWLETDNYEKLPANAFTQGYLRNYAKHLGIDADAVIVAYQATAEVPTENWTAAVRPARPGIADYFHRHPGVFLTGASVAAGLLVLAVLVAVWPEDSPEATDAVTDVAGEDVAGEEVDASASESSAVDSARTPIPVGDPGSAQSAGPQGALAGSLTGSVTDSATGQGRAASRPAGRFSQPVLPSSAASRPTTPRVDPRDPLAHIPIAQTFPVEGGSVELVSDDDPVITPAEAGVRRVTPVGSDRISVRFAQDCWFEVKDLEGKQLFATLGKPGDALELVGAGPFQLVLGYAFGAELTFNSESIDLVPYIRNDVASLVVGR